MKQQVQTWIEFLKVRYAKNTVINYRRTLEDFVKTLEDGDSFTVAAIEDYITHIAANRSKQTANTRLIAIKSFCRWYTKRYGGINPAASVQLFNHKETHTESSRCLEPREFCKVLDATEVHKIDHDILEFVGHTGLRTHEFLSLNAQSINKDMLYFTGKGNKARAVPLNSKAQEILTHNTDGETLQFVTHYRNRHQIYNMCLRAAHKANIPPFGLHAIRHYFCTQLIRAGVPIKLVSKIMGHATVAITEMVYCHITDEDITGVTDILISN